MRSEARVYGFCGLRIASEAPLPSFVGVDGEPGPDAVRFRVVADLDAPASPEWLVVRTFQGDTRPWLSVARLALGGYLLRVHGLADFRVDATGSEILCAPAPNCAPASIEQLLADQVLPQVLHLRGRPCFHASAVADREGDVVAFLGPSGAGKSTLAGSFGAMCSLVSDDCLALTLGDRVLVEPSYPSVRLFRDSAAVLSATPAELPSASPHTDKLRVARTPASGPLVLRRIHLLAASDDGVSMTRLGAKEALLRLAEHLHRLDPLDRARLAGELSFLEQIVRRVPIVRLAYPRSFDALAEVRARVLEDAAR